MVLLLVSSFKRELAFFDSEPMCTKNYTYMHIHACSKQVVGKFGA